FHRLTSRHTGDYLARTTADCVRQFGLETKLHALTMDNASNCDLLADELTNHIDGFRGKLSRVRCF
ncbi:hypothetical protein EDD15DRAFT_2114400, partial [Pisolithus albus]